MCAALSADAIFVYKHSGKEKREYLKEIEMNDGGGVNAVFGCRRLCGKF